MTYSLRLGTFFIALSLYCDAALAHTELSTVEGFYSGLLHPILGIDHVAAMFAVGLWGAVLGQPALWALPVAFPLMMVVGAAVGIAGVEIGFVEQMIALSGVVLGLLVLSFKRLNLWLSMLIVAGFAIFHGYAHGTELPEAADPAGYAIGFVVGTGILHGTGIGIGALDRFPRGRLLIRALGAAVAGVGLYFLV
jgi:urease accessory protein